MSDSARTLLVEGLDVPGVLASVAGVFARRETNITAIQTLPSAAGRASMTIEVDGDADVALLVSELSQLPAIQRVSLEPSLLAIYGKRVIIMGGGAQVGQVAVGAISEADRHNIRGERISVDTIPLVGERALADAVRAVARLPRAQILVLAGAIMGGDITAAVRELQQHGIRGDLAEHGRQRARSRRPGRDRPAAGRRHGRHGRCRHRQVRHRPAARP